MVRVHEELPRDASGDIDIDAWLLRAQKKCDDLNEVAFQSAARLLLPHAKKTTLDGLEVLPQGLAIAELLIDLKLDNPSIQTGLLYPAFRAQALTPEAVKTHCGQSVLDLLTGMMYMDMMQSLGGDIDEKTQKALENENLRRLLLAVVEDVRVVVIKLAERVAVMRASVRSDAKIQKHLARESEYIYAPLANRLGIGQLKWELEDIAFRFKEPDTYKRIAKLLDEKRTQRQAYIDALLETLKANLTKEEVDAKVYGRAKHIFSIYRKMRAKNVEYGDLYDVRAVRIVVTSVRDCYAALGIVHSLWQHIPREFDDYIATPKENGYRSLHTAVVGPAGKVIEVQIRTFEMHQESELGFAAHWRYKEGGSVDPAFESKIQSLRKILELQTELDEEDNIDEILRSELFQDRVYVYTPRGDVIDLPQDSTPLDFAYAVHTEIGHRCRGAKVNGNLVPLTFKLKSGDQIEVLTGKISEPSRDWLSNETGFLKSPRARAKVSTWFRKQNRDKAMLAGKQILEKEQKRLNLSEKMLDDVLPKLGLKSRDDLFAGIGTNEIKLTALFNLIQSIENPLGEPEEPIKVSATVKPKQTSGDIVVAGVSRLMTHLAKCCHPVPGEHICGFVTLGRGVAIHRYDCQHMLEARASENPRLVEAEWSQRSMRAYPVHIEIEANDRRGLLKDITSTLSQMKVNVTAVTTQSHRENNTASMQMTVEVSHLAALSSLLARLQQVPGVVLAKRM